MPSDGPSWAKAPEFADQPEVRARLRAETEEDRRSYLEDGLQRVRCRRCGTCVLAKKNSPKHTSIQWTTDPAGGCTRYAAQVADGGTTAVLDTCPDLKDSIDESLTDAPTHLGQGESRA